jgi:hypothetical protein
LEFFGVIVPYCKVRSDFRNGDSCMKHASVITYVLTQPIVADKGNRLSLVLCLICSIGPFRVLCQTVRNIISYAGSIYNPVLEDILQFYEFIFVLAVPGHALLWPFPVTD